MNTTALERSAPDFAAIKQRQQATWASGDFSVVASRIVYQAEQLCETADLQAGGRLVGIISHVPELKERIPAALEVVQGSRGSTARFVA